MAQVTTIGIDLAKNVMCIHGVDIHGNVVVKKRLSRQKVLPFAAQLPSCLIGMEASGGAHYWGRELTKLGHTVQLMAPQFVKRFWRIGAGALGRRWYGWGGQTWRGPRDVQHDEEPHENA